MIARFSCALVRACKSGVVRGSALVSPPLLSFPSLSSSPGFFSTATHHLPSPRLPFAHAKTLFSTPRTRLSSSSLFFLNLIRGNSTASRCFATFDTSSSQLLTSARLTRRRPGAPLLLLQSPKWPFRRVSSNAAPPSPSPSPLPPPGSGGFSPLVGAAAHAGGAGEAITRSSLLARAARWFLLVSGALLWLEVLYVLIFTDEMEEDEDTSVVDYYGVDDLDDETLEAKAGALVELANKLRAEAMLQGHLGGDFVVWNNIALPTDVPAQGLACDVPSGKDAWYPSLILISEHGLIAVNTCFVQHNDEWILTAVRAYALTPQPDVINAKGSLPHGLKYYSRLT